MWTWLQFQTIIIFFFWQKVIECFVCSQEFGYERHTSKQVTKTGHHYTDCSACLFWKKKTPLAQRTLFYFTSRMLMWNFSLILSLSSKYKRKATCVFDRQSLHLVSCLYKEKWKGRAPKNLSASWLGKMLHQTKLLFYGFIWTTTENQQPLFIAFIFLSAFPEWKLKL